MQFLGKNHVFFSRLDLPAYSPVLDTGSRLNVYQMNKHGCFKLFYFTHAFQSNVIEKIGGQGRGKSHLSMDAFETASAILSTGLKKRKQKKCSGL